ncbi:MAG: hypothetical protein H0U76_02545 [Ktedonobacteraceae bacterium]|nr:hypothetical protein [Ktedonobacteraceae bacterium]
MDQYGGDGRFERFPGHVAHSREADAAFDQHSPDGLAQPHKATGLNVYTNSIYLLMYST